MARVFTGCGGGALEGGLKDVKADVSWAFGGEFRDKARGLTGDGVLRVDKTGYRGEVRADSVEDITNVVAKDFFVVLASEEVVAIGVEGFVAVAAGGGCEGWGEEGEAEFSLEEDLEDVIGEAVGFNSSVVGAKGDAGEVGEKRGHGAGNVWWGCEGGVCHSRIAVVVVGQGGEAGEVAFGGELVGCRYVVFGTDDVVDLGDLR
jgi:hypothetical protein